MSRMRLMRADEPGSNALECLYCGATAESKPPYAVVYCDCRSRAAQARRTAGRERIAA